MSYAVPPANSKPISYGRRVRQWADKHPQKPAIIFIDGDAEPEELTWLQVDQRSNQIARLLAQNGVNSDSTVVIGLPNCPEHYLVSLAGWKLGALVISLRPKLPERERVQLLELANAAVVVADWHNVPNPQLKLENVKDVDRFSAGPLPDITAHPGKAVASGGSTGRPKLIVDPNPWASTDDTPVFALLGIEPSMVHLVSGPLYHNAPYLFSHRGFFQGHTIVLTARFDAAQVADLIETYQVSYTYMAPIMMSRIAKLPDIKQKNLRSIRTLIHTAAPCPKWLKLAWIDLIGGENLLELFGATEAVGICTIRGNEWLQHEGSVGQPVTGCEMRILNANGDECQTGEVGEIFMRWTDPDRGPAYTYIGSNPAKKDGTGFSSVGDLGWADADGYLFIADRRVDMIISGGANVYPAEVEAVLTEHEAIADVAVIGLPDEEWGRRVHAIVQFKEDVAPVNAAALEAFCKARLVSYKAPKTFEFVDSLPRNSAGKLRRTDLVKERS